MAKAAEPVTRAEAELDTVVTMHGKEFTIGPPDGVVVLRVLRIVGAVGLRAQNEAARLGRALFAAAKAGGEGEEVESSISQALWFFLAVLDEDDLYKLGAALLQFPDEHEGVRWLKRNGVLLGPLAKALMLNLQQMDDVMEALANFTGALKGIQLGRMSELLVSGSEPQAS